MQVAPKGQLQNPAAQKGISTYTEHETTEMGETSSVSTEQ